MAETRAEEIIRRQERMASDRSVYESHWSEVAEVVLPSSRLFQRKRTPGQKESEQIFDSTAIFALERFAAAEESMLTPRTQKWHTLKPTDERLEEEQEVSEYLDQVTEVLFSARYSPKANFASQSHESYMSIGAFGPGVLFVDDMIGRGLRYRAIHLSEVYFAENHQGIVDTVFRRFSMTARQAVQKWGEDKLSEKIREAAEKNPEQEFQFIHAVMPREELGGEARGYRGKPIASCYVSIEGRQVVAEDGYYTMPYIVGRHVTTPGEIYGRSPAMAALADIRMLNRMSRATIRSAERVVDPPLLLQEDGALQAFDLRSGALNFGGVDDQGRQVVHPLQTGGRVDIGLEMMDQRRRAINDGFLVTLFQILVEQPQMTATEAMLRAQEKGALLAPTMGRLQSEFLGPMVERELDILGRAGALPPMPRALLDAGGLIRIEYDSPMTRAQRAGDGVAIMRTLEAVTPLAQVDPGVLQVFDPEEIARELAEINGVPSKILRSREALAAMKEQAAQAAQAQALLQAAPVASGVVKDLAQAQAQAGGAPPMQGALLG